MTEFIVIRNGGVNRKMRILPADPSPANTLLADTSTIAPKNVPKNSVSIQPKKYKSGWF